jgi:HlyD family secretion protein
MKKLLVVMMVLAFCAVVGGGGFFYYRCKIAEPKWVTGTASRGEIRKIVSATGVLGTLDTVELGCQISGIVSSLTVDFNDEVVTGQLLAVIDPTAYQAQLNQAIANHESSVASEKSLRARLLTTQAGLAGIEAEMDVQNAAVKKARIALDAAKRHLGRTQAIFQKKMIPESDLDDAKSNVAAAEATVEGAAAQVRLILSRRAGVEAQITGAQAELEGAAAQIRQMTAQIEVARANLEKTKVHSPISGVVISRNISVGQTVTVGQQTPILFTIAQDLRKMQIEALIDESDVCRVTAGQVATFTVDPFPDRRFRGVVRQVRVAPKVDAKIMYPVILDVENPDRALKPGLTAKMDIQVEHQTDVLHIPTEALFFTPPPDILARYPKKETVEQANEHMGIWILNAQSRLEPLEIQAGISNAQFTEVLSTNLASGATVVKYKHEWWMGWFQR